MKIVLLLMALMASAAFGQQSLAEKCARAILRPVTVTAATGNVQAIAAISGDRIVCSLSFNADTQGNIKLTTGTGTNCGTGTADFTGTWQNATGLVLVPFVLPSGLALCINFSATVNAGGSYQVVAP